MPSFHVHSKSRSVKQEEEMEAVRRGVQGMMKCHSSIRDVLRKMVQIPLSLVFTVPHGISVELLR